MFLSFLGRGDLSGAYNIIGPGFLVSIIVSIVISLLCCILIPVIVWCCIKKRRSRREHTSVPVVYRPGKSAFRRYTTLQSDNMTVFNY